MSLQQWSWLIPPKQDLSPEAKTQKNELDTCLIILDPCLLKPVSIARHGSNYSENLKKGLTRRVLAS